MAAKKKMPPELLEKFKAKNAKKQGKNDRDDESIAARRGKKSQSLKDRRDESKAAEKKAGKRPYSKVDKTRKKGKNSKNTPGDSPAKKTPEKKLRLKSASMQLKRKRLSLESLLLCGNKEQE
tara:strand:+ start:207 stop:572 length:366 start_codon:yes stop_codon:yes gene_type:complete